MRKIIYLLMVAVMSFSGLASAQNLAAQNDPKAQEILDAMSKKYKDMAAFKAKFSFTLENDKNGIKDGSDGEIVVKGQKFHLKLPGQEIFNNGTTVWTYSKESGGTGGDLTISAPDTDEDAMNPTKIYSLYKKGYKYVMMSDNVKEGTQLFSIVDLEPIDKKSQFYKIRITINKKDKSVKSWKMYERSGNRYTYTIKNFIPDYKVDDAYFTFDKTKYKVSQETDLR
ncbi:MAG: LolA family protein [Cytophagaceae bacterium]